MQLQQKVMIVLKEVMSYGMTSFLMSLNAIYLLLHVAIAVNSVRLCNAMQIVLSYRFFHIYIKAK